MGTRGRSVHIRSRHTATLEKALSKLGVRIAVLGSSNRWVSIVPIDDGGALDGTALAAATKAAVLQIWTDDDAGLCYQLFVGGTQSELTIQHDGSYTYSTGDGRWITRAVAADVLDRATATTLRTQLRGETSAIEAWSLEGGLERLVGVPDPAPMPVPCDLARVRAHARRATVIKPAAVPKAARPKPMRATPQHLPPSSRRWSKPERAIVDLLHHYVSDVWSMNDWKVYNLYKKHLGPQYRSEVDRMINLMQEEADEELRALHEAILAAVWEHADWKAVVCDPTLGADDFRDAAHRRDWQQRVARVTAS